MQLEYLAHLAPDVLRRWNDEFLALAPGGELTLVGDDHPLRRLNAATFTAFRDRIEGSGLSPSTLRYYEDAGVIDPRRSRSGHRDYSEDDVRTLRCLAALRRAGMSVRDMRDVLVQVRSATSTDGSASHDAIARCLAIVDEHRRRLASDAAELERLVAFTLDALDALRERRCPQ